MNLEIPEGPFEAYIFDCDGTLVDSMPLHYRAWSASFIHHGAPFEFTEEYFYASAGVPDLEIVRRLNEKHGASLDGHSVEEHKLELYHQHLHEIEPIDAVAALACELHGQFPLAVASGSALEIVDASLRHTKLHHLFDTVVTAEMVEHGKPAPDIFLLCAERLGVAPETCLVFEDGPAGIEAATAAGMKSVFVPQPTRAT